MCFDLFVVSCMMFLAGNLGLRFRFAWMSPIVLQLGIVLRLVTLWIGGQWWHHPACHGTCSWVVICFACICEKHLMILLGGGMRVNIVCGSKCVLWCLSSGFRKVAVTSDVNYEATNLVAPWKCMGAALGPHMKKQI